MMRLTSLALQRRDGLGHRQVGLAGARGTDAEDHGVLVDGVDVGLLVHGLGPDGLAAAGEDLQPEHGLGVAGAGALEHAHQLFDGLRGNPGPVGRERAGLGDHPQGPVRGSRLAGDPKVVAPGVELDARVGAADDTQ